MDFKIILCLDLSILLWISKVYFAWISKVFFAWISIVFFAWILKFFFASSKYMHNESPKRTFFLLLFSATLYQNFISKEVKKGHLFQNLLFCLRTSFPVLNVLFCFRTSYSFLNHPFLFLNILSCFRTSLCVLKCDFVFEKQQILAILLQKLRKSAIKFWNGHVTNRDFKIQN